MMEMLAIGTKLGKWTILEAPSEWYDQNGKKRHTVRCVCECGRVETIGYKNVYYGTSKQCRACALKIARSARKIHNFTVLFNGRSMPIDEAMRESGTTLDYKTIRGRMRYGMNFQEIVTR